MYYRFTRKGNYFRKWMFEDLFGENTIDYFIKEGEIEKVSGELYKGTNENPRSHTYSLKSLIDSNIQLLVSEKGEYYSIRDAKKLSCNIPLALSSGFVRYTRKGLILEDVEINKNTRFDFRPEDYSWDVLMRKGNIYSREIFKLLRKETVYSYRNMHEEKGGYIKGIIDDPLSKILTFENDSLLGTPYIYYKELREGRKSEIEVTEKNFPSCLALLKSGHVFIRGNKLKLDVNDIKFKKLDEWESKNIIFI